MAIDFVFLLHCVSSENIFGSGIQKIVILFDSIPPVVDH